MAISKALSTETLPADRLIARADPSSRARGQSYFLEGRVRLESLDLTDALFRVRGTRQYEVIISVITGNPEATCTCALGGTEEYPCKHIVACLLTLRNYLRLNAPPTWEAVLSKVLDDSTARRGATATTQLLFFSLQKRYSSWGLFPYALAAGHFPQEVRDDPQAIARIIRQEKLSGKVSSVRSLGNPRRFANLTDGSQAALQVLAAIGQYGYYYGGASNTGATLLPQIADSLVFHGTEGDPLRKRLNVSRQLGTPNLELTETPDGMRLRALVALGDDKPVAVNPRDTEVVFQEPLWLLSGSDLFGVDDASGAFEAFINTPELTVPPEQQDLFLSRYLLPLAERIPLRGDMVSQEEIHADPIARLYLSEEGGEMQAQLRFGYGDYELVFDRHRLPVSLQRKSGELTLVRVHRQPEVEEQRWHDIGTGFGLKRGSDPDLFALRAKTDPLDFLLHQVPRLAEAGFEIYGEDTLKTAKINRNRPTISFSVSSGIDWFDVQAVVNFGDTEVSLKEVRKAVKKREKYVKLADGSIGAIPEEWMERYKHLFGMTEETDEGLRLGQGQITLLDQLLAEGDRIQADPEFERRRQRLRSFSKITPHPLPEGLAGEPRPYQKAGYDWLHFLHEYEFGGCLADDMGLGKTLTTLAFLQSLKETGHAKAATLIVLPRSLIFNWEREAAKWTPELTLLNHAHTSRAKDLAEFDKYDLVLTTYGIMLRDITILRQHRFHYVILDEAQAIKNPVSQTGKAARLLQADHRLTLTGTPVENSTLELWSQFAFLNPGLLGNLEYFRTEFATTIEKHQDEASAAFLRKMVHPFILRRTKDQVAKDLPPRTERILYAEMEPAQRKLYDKKRDYYRAQVLGLIEEEGINDARMKILEGLLRLRQISNHPRLAEAESKSSSGKFEMLLETLDTLRAEGHKALVFSQFVGMLKIVREALDARKIPYAYLDGSTKDREARVDAFQNDPNIPFFLISLKAGGVGLNLTAADYVIHIDPWWNPAVEMQATDRTHRIGQDKPVFVYKLIARDTVEEKILQLQDRKRELVNQLIATEGSFFKSLTRQDVEMLFT